MSVVAVLTATAVAGHRRELLAFHSHVLHFKGQGQWALTTTADYLSSSSR